MEWISSGHAPAEPHRPNRGAQNRPESRPLKSCHSTPFSVITAPSLLSLFILFPALRAYFSKVAIEKTGRHFKKIVTKE
jgi:hypothetical protein